MGVQVDFIYYKNTLMPLKCVFSSTEFFLFRNCFSIYLINKKCFTWQILVPQLMLPIL